MIKSIHDTGLPQMYEPLLSPRNASIHAAILILSTPWSPRTLEGTP